jgi:CelD/BcsL family acetyltransferase involved in cellulose biosynthesis
VRKTKYRLFAQPFGFFANLHSAFAGDDRIFVLLAEINGEPVAGILFLVHGDTLYYKFNASTEVGARPNDLLVWRGMLLGRELGLAALDFGVSDLDQPGLVRFKRKFATEERPVTELRWRGDGVDHRAREAGALLGRLTKTLTAPEVPDAVSRAVGDEVYRLFC